jgi:uncharacterized sulfatase
MKFGPCGPGLLLALLSCGVPAVPDPPPNIVLIISDDHGWMDYGFLGHEAIKTPALDRLASQSMVYTRGYLPAPVCRPSLATLATGLYPHQHRITGNDPPGEWPAIARDVEARAQMEAVFAQSETVVELLGRSGYASHQSGKWWEGNPLDHGFTAAMTHGDVTRGGRHGDDGLVIGREGLGPIYEFIEATRSTPFFLWYGVFLPHTPHNPPERLLEKYQVPGRAEPVARYYAMVEWLDETVGELCDYLDENGLADNTVVLYIADNGWLSAEDRAQQAKVRAKMSPYDMGVRTPVMIRWPGKVPPGRDDVTLVSSVDLVPTMLRAAGIEPSPELPGIDLLDREALSKRDRVFGETSAHTAVDIEDPAANLKYRSVVRSDGWKLILPYTPNREVTLTIRGTIADWMRFEPELYQLVDDPHETKDLAAERPDIVAELRASLQKWWEVPE